MAGCAHRPRVPSRCSSRCVPARLRPRARAFSLVELIVVMSITSISIALLMPALDAARRRAKLLQCRSNLRQLGLAYFLYADAHRDLLMPVSTYDWTNPYSSELYWFGEVLPDDPGSPTPPPERRLDRTKGFLMPFLENNRAVKDCPTFRTFEPVLRFDGATSGYGYNYAYLGPGVEWRGVDLPPAFVMVNLNMVRGKTQTVVFADSAGVNWFAQGATADGPRFEENYYLEAPSAQFPTVHFRHGGRANVLFLDGHVASMRPTENPLPSWWPPRAVELVKRMKLADIGQDDSFFKAVE